MEKPVEKPVRIVDNEKLRSFNERVKNGLEHALNFMLGTPSDKPITIAPFDPFLMPVAAYLQAYRKHSVMIKIHSDQDYQGELYWFFEMKAAVVLGAQMRMMLPAAIEEKLKKGEFDANDQDAFGELGNQLCGILDRAFRALTRKNIHLRMDFDKKVYPHESIQLSSFKQEEEYVVLLSQVTVPGFKAQKLTLLLPRSLYETMLNLEVKLEGIEPRKVVLYTFDEGRRLEIPRRMNSRYVKVLTVEDPDDVLRAIEQPGVVAAGIELSGLNFPLSHQDSILLKRFASNRHLGRVPYFLSWPGAAESEVHQLELLGLSGASSGNFPVTFPAWASAFTKAPAKT